MAKKHISRLHWRLFFPLVGSLWVIIGITIVYFVRHEEERQEANLENRLLNVNHTVIDAYERSLDLQSTVDFIKLFTEQTTLDPLRLTVYDADGRIIADNSAPTIHLYDRDGQLDANLYGLWGDRPGKRVGHVRLGGEMYMVTSMTSVDGRIHSFSALPYEGEVITFLSIDPMVWIVVILLGVITTAMAYFGARAVSRNVYALQQFANDIASNRVPGDADARKFSHDELGDVSRNLLRLYRDKIHAENEKVYHERQIGMNVSHELNTPVGIVKGYLDTVLSDPTMPEEQQHRFLLRAQQNVDRLANLIGDVDKVMQLQNGGVVPDREPIGFREMLEALSEDVRQGHIIGDIEFVYDDVPADCRVLVHKSLLVNAMLNLIRNAVQYSGGSRMEVRWLGKADGLHEFTFADNGTGIEEKHLGRIFDMFYRVDSGRSRRTGGTGLGLPLVRHIIVSCGGDITAANGPDGGLVFTFRLPEA